MASEPMSSLDVALSALDEAERVHAAYKIVTARRTAALRTEGDPVEQANLRHKVSAARRQLDAATVILGKAKRRVRILRDAAQ